MKWIFCSVNERFGHGARIVGETEITQRLFPIMSLQSYLLKP